MRLSIEDTLERIDETEDTLGKYREYAKVWEKMWCLDAGWNRSTTDAINVDGQEQVTLPTPYNVVSLAERLITTEPDIDVPPRNVDVISDSERDKKQRWLKAMWQRASHQSRRDIIGDAWWTALVRGRGVFEVKWVDNVLPKRMRKNRIPILIRTLDPLNCGFKHGPLYTEHAYHKWEERPELLKQIYPKLKFEVREDRSKRRRPGRMGEADTVEVVDFWYVSPKDGSIWNAVVVDRQMAKAPTKTDYYDIPLVQFRGENYPIGKEEYDGLSLLHPIKDLWPYQSRLASQIGTGLLWYFWPHMSVQNEYGEEMPDRDIKPGETVQYPWGTKIEMIQMAPNVPMADKMMQIVHGASQQSTFPEVMYGEAPGDLQAGYGVSLLADAAKGRVKKPRRNLEMAIEVVNEIALCMVEAFGDEDEGVSMWGHGEREAGQFTVTLLPEEIDGYYENRVTISPRVPTDELQKTTLGIRLAEGGHISDQTLRKKYIGEVLPDDEQQRIVLEQAMKSETLAPAVQRRTLEKYFGPNWREELGLDQPMPQPGVPPGMQMTEEGQLVPMPSAAPMMNGIAGAPPPGMAPEPPTMPLPPEMGGPPPEAIQPESISGGVLPPALEGQLERGPMGLPPDTPPELLAAALGRGEPTEDEILRRLRGDVNNG
jgi:hypothetical protein